MTRRLLTFALYTLLAACSDEAPPRAQWLVRVGTDAPVPELGDRLLVELLDEQGALACASCTRSFGLGRSDGWPISFGIADPSDGRAFRLRLRLFRSERATAGGFPGGGLPIDIVGTLPPTRGSVHRVKAVLPLSRAGVAAQLGADVADFEYDDGSAIAMPGSNPLALVEPCKSEAPPNMVCIPGGLFVLGAEDATEPRPTMSSMPERLVRVQPFVVDRNEVAVGDVRALVQAGKIVAPTSREENDGCTYSRAEGELERHPVNCISHDVASAVCNALGKRLPTEAEWEFMAGNRSDETVYPWGDDDDYCHRAVIGRGRPLDAEISLCTGLLGREGTKVAAGPVAVDAEGDETRLGVRHLGGNVAEWVEDVAHGYDAGDCLGPDRALVSPRCLQSRDGNTLHVVRGSSWDLSGHDARTTTRNTKQWPSPTVGFRCVKDL